MRLSKIKLAGFKSFVDPTTIPLPSNLVGVVGPNGCGKSNVIDAVRWVMGESSAKHLRGDSMADVIFNGSSSRKPVGQATVELVFDNSDGQIGGQYAQYNEISISRTVTRDGQSIYQLNGSRCRRRDITDIFLGTGLGPRSYAIIEQGMISRLIEARPEDLRVFLEEAAGISKYKERRRETENRIKHTRENLDRLNDLRDELDKQLAHLQRQARTAERYKEFKQEERLIKGQLHALRWQGLDGEAAGAEHKIGEQETLLEAQLAQQRNAEAGIERLREKQIEATDNFNTVQSGFYSVGADIARLEQSIQHARERRQQQQQDLEQVERSWHEAQSHMENDTRRIDELATALTEQEPALEQAQQEEQLQRASLQATEETMHLWQGQWDEFNQQSSVSSQTAQVERARLQQLESQLKQQQQRLQRLEEERQLLSTDELEHEVVILSEQQAEAELHVAGLHEQLDRCLAGIATQREQNHLLSNKLDGWRAELHSQSGRHASLQALQQAALGKRQGAVTDWLKRQGLSDAQRLAQGLSVEPGWEKAVETVLGASLEAVCVPGVDPLAELLQGLEQGYLTLFDTNTNIPASNGSLAAKVKAPWNLASLLEGVHAVDSLAEALALRAKLATHESVITRDGIWLGTQWLRVSRAMDEHAGVLQREQELRELASTLAELSQQIETAEQDSAAGRESLKQQEEERETLQRQLNEINHQASNHKAQLSGKQARLEQIRQRHERLQIETQELQQQLQAGDSEMGQTRSRLHQAMALMEDNAIRREELSHEREEYRAALEQARELTRQAAGQAHDLALAVEGTRTALSSTRQALERMAGQINLLAQRREELRLLLSDSDEPAQTMADELAALLNRRMQVEKQLAEARKHVEDIDHELRRLEHSRMGTERQAQEIRNTLERLRLQAQELKIRRQTMHESITGLGFVLEVLLAEMPAHADESGWQQQLDELEQKIQRLGPINLAAIDEYTQQSERKNYLDEQNKDLIEALETLENAIRKIDRETRTRFKETFDQVNKGFQEKFPRLFGGGHAYLELTGDDLLDTGVTVMARPPGKRNSTIHLLSGGEKALTAVALVFAIFDLNPSPFCMLDEVDAPLDEANVGRFCKMVKEMSERVQFIFITHNKVTMELAAHLTGVTMHEPGVSRMVAVDVDEAVALAAV
ncbi:MAG: chromosome segregation protein SMC [Thiohalomonadaceae bacterium]